MKDSVKGIIWMSFVLFLTIVWDIVYVFCMTIFIEDSKDLLTGILFCVGFTILTIPWNFVVIRGFCDAIERRKLEKQKEENGK